MAIYIVSHLRLKRPTVQGYRAMYVGPMSGAQSPDDFADTDAALPVNISHKNKTFCELTALHQIAQRHAQSPEAVVGLVHYRRRFIDGPAWIRKTIRTTQKFSWSRAFSNALLNRFELSQRSALQLLESCDVILPSVTHLKKNIRDSYIDAHIPEDWIKLKQIIHTDFADYADAFDKFERNHAMHFYNMFVARSSFLQGYATWLFAVMEKLEMEIDPQGRTPFQARVFGFLSERLFNVYLLKHSELTKRHMPVVQLYNESVIRPL